MKKIINILIAALMLMTAMTVCAAATEGDSALIYNYEFNGTEYTVEFPEDDTLSADMRETIAREIIGMPDTAIETRDTSVSEVVCSFFGHKYEYSYPTATSHKVNTYSPRCLEQVYEVAVCKNCKNCETTLLSSTYIYCCAED